MEDLSRRLTNLEHQVGEIRTDVATIKATMPSLATKEQVAILPQLATKDSVAEIKAILPHIAYKSDLEKMHSSLLKWMFGAAISSGTFIAGIVFGLIKLFS